MIFTRTAWFVLFLAVTGHAGPEDDFILATMRLSEAPNYRWTTTVGDNARIYKVEGRVLANGYTWVRLPMIESIALRMRRTDDESFEAVFKGLARSSILTPGGWKSLPQLPRRHSDWDADSAKPYIRMRNAGNRITPEGQRPYSNAQFGLNCPHQELAIIVSCYHALQVTNGEASGILSNIGAQLLLVSDCQDQIRPVIAAGRFKLWMDGGRVTRYQLELEGVLLVDGQECLVNQVSATILSDIGTTSFEIPEIVRRQLEPQGFAEYSPR